MAHIIPATTGGPRDPEGAAVSAEQRAHPTNIVLLCANCHTIVDKRPEDYPAAILSGWKLRRTADIARALLATQVETRRELHEHLEPLLSKNALIFETYGPDDSLSEDRAARWHREAVRSIVPANRKIADLLLQNRSLLTPGEQGLADRFLLHAEQFASRHLFGDSSPGTLRFPDGMDQIGKDADGHGME